MIESEEVAWRTYHGDLVSWLTNMDPPPHRVLIMVHDEFQLGARIRGSYWGRARNVL